VALVDDLRRRPDGDVHRIEVAIGGEDPLVALRSSPDLDTEAFTHLRRRLERPDASSPTGPWTRRYLRLIEAGPHVRTEVLAMSIGLDEPASKSDVRKLKALGLTIGRSPGCEISPRGRAFLAQDRT
jgi:hypothetical protein